MTDSYLVVKLKRMTLSKGNFFNGNIGYIQRNDDPELNRVLSLAPLVHKITTNYINRKIKGKDEKPLLSYFPDIQEEQEKKVLEGEE